mmetsp:Transcript_1028/g.3153  ORF Transcript_1028/g.3153 Transcript_1028/m.3153 type:complete len:116 (+) Transcript_1028:335-682(+)
MMCFFVNNLPSLSSLHPTPTAGLRHATLAHSLTHSSAHHPSASSFHELQSSPVDATGADAASDPVLRDAGRDVGRDDDDDDDAPFTPDAVAGSSSKPAKKSSSDRLFEPVLGGGV